MIEREEDLKHVGIKGMRWGVRKERKSSNRQAKRADKVSKLNAKAERYRLAVTQLNSNPVDGKFRNVIRNSKIKKIKKKELQAIKDAQAKSEGKLTRREKQILVGSAIVATYALYSIGSAAQSGELNRLAMKGEAFLKNNGSMSFKKNPNFAKDFTDAETLHKTVASGVNDFNAIGGKVNCRRATMAYEMRRRGHDVVATRTTTGRGQTANGLYNSINPDDKHIVKGKISALKRLYDEETQVESGKLSNKPYTEFVKGLGASKGFKESGFLGEVKIKDSANMTNSIYEKLSDMPNKSRGELSIGWKGGGKHSVAWEIVNNKPVLMDIQTGKLFKESTDFHEYGENVSKAALTRLDNKRLNEDFLMRWVKNAK